VKVAGLKETLIALNKIEPELRKQFLRDVNEVAEPALTAARNAYKFVPLSGMSRSWDGTGVERRAAGRISGRKVFPLTVEKAQRGIKVRLDTRRKATSSIVIEQTDSGWAVFETAGRKTTNPLGTHLGPLAPGRTRLFGRAVFANRDKIERAVEKVALKAVNKFNTDMRRLD